MQYARALRISILLSLLLMFQGCIASPSQQDIADLQEVPQDAQAFTNPQTADIPIITAAEQSRLAVDFLQRHFSPWGPNPPQTPPDKAFWILPTLENKTVYGENLLPWSVSDLTQLTTLAQPKTYPSQNRSAITVHATSLRALPTQKPCFFDPELPGQGYPFDQFQNSALWAGTPVRITHQTKGGQWLFAETTFAFGWLPARDIAFTDSSFKELYQQLPQLTLLSDNLPLSDEAGLYRCQGRLGMLLPLAQRTSTGYRAYVAAADERQHAKAVVVTIPQQAGSPFPLEATPKHLAHTLNLMAGEKYGWGGYLENRDCSATLRDFYSPFGLWLPRNSAKQIGSGARENISALSVEEKNTFLLDQGIAFRTLVWRPGHIMLYVGQHHGKAVVFHNVWGLKTGGLFKGEGRKIIGKAVFTTLWPGDELPELARPEGLMAEQIQAICVVGPPADNTSGH